MSSPDLTFFVIPQLDWGISSQGILKLALSFGLCSSGCKKLGNFRISLGNSSFSLRNSSFFRIKLEFLS